MKVSIVLLAAVALAPGCDSKSPAAPEMAGTEPAATCISPVMREVALTTPNARDVLEARVIGPDCEKASLVLTLHKADGTLLWTAAVLPPELQASFQDAIAALPPLATRSARDFSDLILALHAPQAPQR